MGYESCPVTTTSTVAVTTTVDSKSGKSSISAKSDKSSKSAKSSSLGQSVIGASGIAPVTVDDTMLLPAEGTITVEELAAEVDEAVENAVKMLNIEQFNLYEGSVNVYKYADANGETEVVETVSTGLRGDAGN